VIGFLANSWLFIKATFARRLHASRETLDGRERVVFFAKLNCYAMTFANHQGGQVISHSQPYHPINIYPSTSTIAAGLKSDGIL